SMKQGIGVLSRLGVTGEDVASFKKEGVFLYENGTTAALPEKFVSETRTLERSCSDYGAGTYNIIGAYTEEPSGTKQNKLVTELIFTVRRNNNGYLVTYATPNGVTVGEEMIHDEERTALTQIDKDHIYVGFFASRNARVTISDVKLTTIAPEQDEKAKARAITYVDPDYRIESGDYANSSSYTLTFYGNADGLLSISGESGKLVSNVPVKAYEKHRVNVALKTGYNEFDVTFVPDKSFQFDDYTKLSNYGAAVITKSVEYKTLSGSTLYVAPNGRMNGKGTESSPLDIATALKFAGKGQTILLMEGTYKMTSPLRVERGIDGTEKEPIVLKADPKAKTRPVIDFQNRSSGMVFGGDWWILSGFDVTGSMDGQKGIQLSGSHCIVENVQTYRNGNTGLQIARLYASDTFEDWPCDNTVRGCVSFLNADKGYEDADGFAAKLTVGNGNRFESCIAAYNADDGWDLYAKVETGSIGAVLIKDCVSFKNGFVLGEDGKEIAAGNGNGFK
ncbi:MAG: hypothetical protein KBS81_03550, partial [Spirochaetales bacterium]|nr:hypothetical protein [Candidatus Physcosoma equi]